MVAIMLILIALKWSEGKISITPNASITWQRFGRPFNISCHYSGSRDHDVRWLKDSRPVLASEQILLSKENSVQGSLHMSDSAIYVKKLDHDDEGNYTCSAGEEFRFIQVKVIQGRMKIFPKEERIITFTNEQAVLTCEYSGNEKLRPTWRKDVKKKVGDFRFTSNLRTVIGSEVTSILKITKRAIEPSDAGEYTCSAGPLTKSVILEVHNGPCGNMLVSGQHGVPDQNMEASSFYEDTRYHDGPSRARLNQEPEENSNKDGDLVTQGGGWLAGSSDRNQWIQVKLKTQSVVREILIQGRSSEDCCNQSHWVTQFKVQYSKDGATWAKYKDQSGNLLFFRGNYDHDTVVSRRLPFPVIARYVRIVPTEWNENIALRFDIKGCSIPKNIRMIYPNQDFINIEVPKKLEITCEYTGPSNANITWFKDGYRILHHHGFTLKSTITLKNGRTTVVSSLSKVSTVYSDSGKYRCKIENTTLTKVVAVHAVRFDKLPSYSRYWLVHGSPFHLSCTYKSREKRQFSWKYEDMYIGSFGFDVNSEAKVKDGAVELTSAVSETSVSRKDEGKYTCLIGGMEKQWDVRVLKPKGNGTSQNLKLYEPMYLDCNVEGLTDDVRFERFWTRGGSRISQMDSKGRMNYLPDGKMLQIIDAESEDAGRYECNILLEAGTTQTQQVVIVKEIHAPPNASVEGQKILYSGDSLHLYCKTTGYPKPYIVWMKNGETLTETGSRITLLPYDGMDNGHLIVFNVNENEAGQYICKAVSEDFPPSTSSLEVKVTDTKPNQNSPVVIVVVIICALVIVLVLLCGACAYFNRRRRKHKYTAYDGDDTPLERLRKERPIVATRRYGDADDDFESKLRVVRLKEEPKLFPKKGELSSNKTVCTVEDVDDTYEKMPLRRYVNCDTVDASDTSSDVDKQKLSVNDDAKDDLIKHDDVRKSVIDIK
ncbi:hypothetical protein FSP39_024404 [Pinctada imbricata]|uniref:Uncharacterized protein n=1 Tax=Pinctada imbricata TaxID=66713 RepID=A0AA88YL98_PINIB|nr:hypothetical protein FSP39_024404 [Pinctada imbricata]